MAIVGKVLCLNISLKSAVTRDFSERNKNQKPIVKICFFHN